MTKQHFKQKLLLLLSSIIAHPEINAAIDNDNFQVTQVNNLRKALSSIKQLKPDVIVAEFVYAPTYGSQLSNFESILAAAQNFAPSAKLIALAHKEDLQHLEKVLETSENCQVLSFPIKRAALESCLDAPTTNKTNH